jgi:hypothetical protein
MGRRIKLERQFRAQNSRRSACPFDRLGFARIQRWNE